MRRRLGITSLTLIVALAGFAGVAATPVGADATHAITVSPSTGLSDGRTVTVAGTGFTETPVINDWAGAQCSGAVLTSPITLDTAINECSQSEPFVFTHADAAGNLSSPLVVHTSFTAGSGAGAHTVTCGQAPDDCAVLVTQLVAGGTPVAAAAPISFGKLAPTLAGCIETFLADHQHRPLVKLHRLLVCVFTALARKPS